MISDEDIKYFASVHAGGAIGEMATELLQYREEKRKAVQSRAKTMRHDEITVPGIYLAKTEVGDEVISLTIRADQINLGTVFMGFAYQGPVEWVEE